MKDNSKRMTVSIALDEADYLKLKELSKNDSRPMASYMRSLIKKNYAELTLSKKIKKKEEKTDE